MFQLRQYFLLILTVFAVQNVMQVQPVQAENKPAITLDEADDSYKVQGEYVGKMKNEEGENVWGAQVVALGDNKYRVWGYPGGLPGKGADLEYRLESKGQLEDGKIIFKGEYSVSTWKDNTIEVRSLDDELLGTMKKVNRQSPTLGKKPPEGAIVLFNGKSADHFKDGKMTKEGLLIQGTTSKETFQDCELHLEFMLSYMPWAHNQDRSNSGCYLQGRYEVQILDSFGMEKASNQCGGIYSVSAPEINMCFPSIVWQTYDIEFTAPKFDDQGKKLSNAKLTVMHNGVLVQKDVEVPDATRAAPVKEGPKPGPLYLQDHNNPVRYRNIWIVKK